MPLRSWRSGHGTGAVLDSPAFCARSEQFAPFSSGLLAEHSDRATIGVRLECDQGPDRSVARWKTGGRTRGISSKVRNPKLMKETKVTVKIPRPLYRKIQLVIEESGFSSPTDFIVFVLRDLMGDTPATKVEAEVGAQEGADFTQEELDDVRRKLENLGYL